MTLAFAACPTLTELKLSDKGLIDVRAGRLLPLELD
jgi:adenine deaminase